MTFKDIAENLNLHLDKFIQEIEKSSFATMEQVPNINGIYVFFENEIPQYVGRTNKKRMQKRIKEHFQKYSNQNSATFAFRIAKELKGNEGLNKIETYDNEFIVAKEQVSKMKIKYIEIDDPIIQTIFEPYLAYRLKTKYNDFITH